jgi:hypothetical protein
LIDAVVPAAELQIRAIDGEWQESRLGGQPPTVRRPMPDPLHPLRFLLALFAGWIHREQAQVVDYLVEENRVFREQLGDRRLRLNDDQRRRLATKGKVLGRSMLAKVATIVTPDTILRWHHALIAAKFTSGRKGVGRPGIMKALRELSSASPKTTPVGAIAESKASCRSWATRSARPPSATR